ncbi:hypothetical protein ACHAW6_004188 [Cyclotella cf. meneghiniana]
MKARHPLHKVITCQPPFQYHSHDGQTQTSSTKRQNQHSIHDNCQGQGTIATTTLCFSMLLMPTSSNPTPSSLATKLSFSWHTTKSIGTSKSEGTDQNSTTWVMKLHKMLRTLLLSRMQNTNTLLLTCTEQTLLNA